MQNRILAAGLIIILCSLSNYSLKAQMNEKINELTFAKEGRSEILFDADWRFYPGDPEGAEQTVFNDSGWRNLDLPHDWSIEDIAGTNSPFDKNAINGVALGFTVGGTGWYRKTFDMPAVSSKKMINVYFEGVYINSTVWVNGNPIGSHSNGYTSFGYDISRFIIPGAKNVIAVKVVNRGSNSRWYSGSGIYRHVWLKVSDPVYLPDWGIVIATPQISVSSAKVHITTKVSNKGDRTEKISLINQVFDKEGKKIAQTSSSQSISANSQIDLVQELEILKPDLWSVDTPYLYTAVSEVKTDRYSDVTKTRFGIRSLKFSQDGFFLNGRKTLLKGGCVHHDNGPLGSKVYARAEERRIELLKASGFNAIRTAHNPPSPEFIEACDRLGMMVIEEAYDRALRPGVGRDMVLRDINHPSIIMWSVGNEIPNTAKPEILVLADSMINIINGLDGSRPVTVGSSEHRVINDTFINKFEVAGMNYFRDDTLESMHNRNPNRIVFATESNALNAFDFWMDVLDRPWKIGDFVWTSFDYIGESSIGWLGYPQDTNFFPWNHAYCGDLDICGFKRPQSYYRDVLWKNGKQLSVFVKPPIPTFAETNPKLINWSKWNWHDVVTDWNWPGYENKPIGLEIYCGYEQVELFMNGKSIGKKETNRSNKWIATFEVPYQPGEIKAIAYTGTKAVETSVLKTALKAEAIKLTADRNTIKPDGNDLCYITVELIDSEGIRNPKAENLIRFEIEGAGSIAAVGSSNPKSTESFQLPRRKAYQGRCLVIVKSSGKAGKIKLVAKSEGFKDAIINIQLMDK